MPMLKHTNPLGQVDLPLIARQGEPFGTHGEGCLEPDEEFEVDDATARVLLEQDTNYAPVDQAAEDIAKAIADERAAERADDDEPEVPPPATGGVVNSSPTLVGESGPELPTPKGDATS